MRRGFDGIQGLRALAAAAVAFLHIADEAGALTGTPGRSPYRWVDALPLEAGVDLFFVISGFVMVWSSWDAFGHARSVAPFVWRRLLRIVPLYWLLTAATVAVAVAAPGSVSDGVRDGWGYIAASFAFLPWRRADGFVQPVLRLGWTLEYEMLFYALLAATLPLAAPRGTAGAAGHPGDARGRRPNDAVRLDAPRLLDRPDRAGVRLRHPGRHRRTPESARRLGRLRRCCWPPSYWRRWHRRAPPAP